MTSGPLTRRCCTIVFFACWCLATGATLGVAGAAAWAALMDGSLDDLCAWLGVPLGAALGLRLAMVTRGRRAAHGRLLVFGVFVLAGGVAGAVTFRALAQSQTGEGWFAGLGYALASAACLIVAAAGVLWIVAAAAGRIAARAPAAA